MKRKLLQSLAALSLALISVVAFGSLASAHEVRHVGPYTFVVGFLNEPAYAQQQNSVDLTICKGTECDYTVQNGLRVVSNPENDADKTLKAEVIMGASAPLALPLSPRYANPGKYSSYFIPSKTGTYTFHFVGTLEGMKIDERFTSSPNTFSDVEQIHVYPTTTQDGSNALQAQVKSAQQSATTAMTVGIVGAVLGVLGLVSAGIALARKPRVQPDTTATTPAQSVDSLRG